MPRPVEQPSEFVNSALPAGRLNAGRGDFQHGQCLGQRARNASVKLDDGCALVPVGDSQVSLSA
jgi:hypothetical protein